MEPAEPQGIALEYHPELLEVGSTNVVCGSIRECASCSYFFSRSNFEMPNFPLVSRAHIGGVGSRRVPVADLGSMPRCRIPFWNG